MTYYEEQLVNIVKVQEKIIQRLKAENARMREALESLLELGDPGVPELYPGMVNVLVYPDAVASGRAALEGK